MEVQQDKPFIIAYYLPQYHPIPENDEWWGKGFTEWTNVAKAKPLFKGHYQPKIPADLGFYDLRVPEVREQQAELAREAGVDGFCYWHYWFGNGKELLERPFKEVVESGKPDFPFCLGWANEDWQAKIWNATRTTKVKETLIKQEYPGETDNQIHFYSYLKAFKDKRYIRIKNKPVFVIYQPLKMADINSFVKQWNFLLKKEGVADEFFFIATARNHEEIDALNEMNIFSGLTLMLDERMKAIYNEKKFIYKMISEKIRARFHKPLTINYSEYFQKYSWIENEDSKENFFPTILSNWDHTPRSGQSGYVFTQATPEAFKKNCILMLKHIKAKDNKVAFLKSWNEWGEGNYMEPDLKYGKGHIEALAQALKESE